MGSLSREQIVAAALRIARTDGLDALTIRRLATDLGASRMALYRHVADKDALVALVLDVVAEQSVPPLPPSDGPWEDRLRRLAHSLRDELGAYPGLIDMLMTRYNHGHGGLRAVDTMLEIMTDAGLGSADAARYYMVFIDIVFGRLHRESHGDPVSPERTAGLLARAGERDDLPHVRAAESAMRAVTAEQIFETELDMLVDAITAAARR
ncbi:TetR/AcrR family transcriptional regulator [Actinophytocola oryzae]|uniref:TetR family transcriptional regulator n=1 Tax=Actinophytocola oryzae TaxID=502181 RepID=A0A4R7VX17_9PSEU|nr:TetR/AcrR family transcriptional regulator C-terminal domain-containing protein [Actinophytocola oryzae]TDV54195.1 TetR family transcriptional regulator [Actinophytocola oryzae]